MMEYGHNNKTLQENISMVEPSSANNGASPYRSYRLIITASTIIVIIALIIPIAICPFCFMFAFIPYGIYSAIVVIAHSEVASKFKKKLKIQEITRGKAFFYILILVITFLMGITPLLGFLYMIIKYS